MTTDQQSERAVLPEKWGLWSEEGQSKSGRYLHSICANDLGPDENGELECSTREKVHVCIAETRGATPAEARELALKIVTAVNERPNLLARIERLEEALRKARVSIATWSPDPTEPLDEIDAALTE